IILYKNPVSLTKRDFLFNSSRCYLLKEFYFPQTQNIASPLYLVMKKITRVICGLSLILICSSWGFFAHYRINRLAVFTLPKGMAGFYKANIEFITEHAVSAVK